MISAGNPASISRQPEIVSKSLNDIADRNGQVCPNP
jgi:hypothetical protein